MTLLIMKGLYLCFISVHLLHIIDARARRLKHDRVTFICTFWLYDGVQVSFTGIILASFDYMMVYRFRLQGAYWRVLTIWWCAGFVYREHIGEFWLYDGVQVSFTGSILASFDYMMVCRFRLQGAYWRALTLSSLSAI